MLLRKQSLFLLAAGILALITWGFPVVTYHQAHEAFVFRTTGLYGANGVALEHIVMKVPFSIILTILGLALLVSITFYRNRPRQMRFVRGTYLLLLAMVAFLFITDNSVQAYLEVDGEVERHFGLSFFAPVVALILAFMAERAIRSDEVLIRSVDRLR